MELKENEKKATKEERKQLRVANAMVKRAQNEALIESIKQSLDVKWREFAFELNGWRVDIENSGVTAMTKKLFNNPEKATAPKISDAANAINNAFQAVFDKAVPNRTIFTNRLVIGFPHYLRDNEFAVSLELYYRGPLPFEDDI